MAKHAFPLPPIIPDDDCDTTCNSTNVDESNDSNYVAPLIDESHSKSTSKSTDRRSQPKQVIIPPPLELLSVAEAAAKESTKSTVSLHKVDGVLSSIPLEEEEEVESGQILDLHSNAPSIPFMTGLMANSPKCVLAPPLSMNRDNDNNDSNTMDVDSNTVNNTKHNDPSSVSFDPHSYNLAANGQLLEDKDEWERRPKLSYEANGEMVFRPLRMQCTHCDESYTKTSDLYAHIRSHQRHTECPHCGKILTCMATFVYHVRTHTMEKPYYCPCDGCDFKNAVKYNLKVHLACIRHGGKSNLAKYAKVLDLDVCDKSLRKRKDNSVHELGSRRSKKRRKLNHSSRRSASHSESQFNHSKYGMNGIGMDPMNIYGMNGHHDPQYNGLNAMNPMLAMQGMSGLNCNMMNGMNSINYPMNGGSMYYGQSQEEYDQFAAQLLFQLSAYQNGNNQIYDPNNNALAQMQSNNLGGLQMDWTQNVQNGQPVLDQNGNIIQQVVDQNGNAVNALSNALKGEHANNGDANALNQQLQQQQQLQAQQQVQQQQIMQMVAMNPQMVQQQFMELKPEQVYDPNFGYFAGVQMQNGSIYPQPQSMGQQTSMPLDVQGVNQLDVNHLNVDPNAKAMGNNMNSKDSTNSKVSNTLSAATPREIVAENKDQQNGVNLNENQKESDGEQQLKENDNQNGEQKESNLSIMNQDEATLDAAKINSEQQESNELNHLIPKLKQEPNDQDEQHQQETGMTMNQYQHYDMNQMNGLMMTPNINMVDMNQMMVPIQVMQQQPAVHYEQYMMAPTYYQPAVATQDAFYGQLQQLQMYGDPAMSSPSNLQQLQMMQMQQLHEVENEKKADPPLPTNLQFLNHDQSEPNMNQNDLDAPTQNQNESNINAQ